MEINNIKNIVVLKNLPSNIVDEAIVVLKNNELIKNKEMIDNGQNKKVKNKNKDYIVKEAENVITSYINNIEKQKNNKSLEELENKYKQLKLISMLLAGLIVLSGILNII
ncbi:MAG: hypothetical protein IKT41_04215 [Clostridia bacterium]|nr:hypothetical protein [Clostridia bacterium]